MLQTIRRNSHVIEVQVPKHIESDYVTLPPESEDNNFTMDINGDPDMMPNFQSFKYPPTLREMKEIVRELSLQVAKVKQSFKFTDPRANALSYSNNTNESSSSAKSNNYNKAHTNNYDRTYR